MKTETTKNNCKHSRLTFLSGGHYIECMDCRGLWVACQGHGKETETGGAHANNMNSMEDVRRI